MAAGHVPPAKGNLPCLAQLLEAALLPSTLSEDAFAPLPLPLGTLRQEVLFTECRCLWRPLFCHCPQRLLQGAGRQTPS